MIRCDQSETLSLSLNHYLLIDAASIALISLWNESSFASMASCYAFMASFISDFSKLMSSFISSCLSF